MNTSTPDASVNWEQIHDLAGDETDGGQQELLADMWKDMKADIQSDWARLAATRTEAELKQSLHRVRGVVSMWGLSEVAGAMNAVENGPEPIDGWRRRSAELAELRDRGMKAIVARYPWLEKGAS